MKKEKANQKTAAAVKAPEEPGIFLWALFILMLTIAIFVIVCGVIQLSGQISMWGIPPIDPFGGAGW